MFMLCLVGMCHAPAPSHHRLLPRANSCRALFPNPRLPPCAIPYLTTDTLSILTILAFHPNPTRFPSLSLLTFPYSPDALAILLLFPHRPSPILATFLSVACVLKRFPLTSPRKLSLPCVKRGFLRTAEPHQTSQLSPCAPLMSQCHVHAVPGSDVPCPTPSPRCHRTIGFSRARTLAVPCVLTPQLLPAQSHI